MVNTHYWFISSMTNKIEDGAEVLNTSPDCTLEEFNLVSFLFDELFPEYKSEKDPNMRTIHYLLTILREGPKQW